MITHPSMQLTVDRRKCIPPSNPDMIYTWLRKVCEWQDFKVGPDAICNLMQGQIDEDCPLVINLDVAKMPTDSLIENGSWLWILFARAIALHLPSPKHTAEAMARKTGWYP